MTLHTVILINAFLDLGVVLAVGAAMLLPFTLDRRRDGAAVYAFADPFPAELAA